MRTNDRSMLSMKADCLRRISEKRFEFKALKDPRCSIKNILKTMEELKEVPFYLKKESNMSEGEVRALSDDLIKECVSILMRRNVPTAVCQTSADELNRYLMKALCQMHAKEYHEALRSLMIYESYGEAIFQSYPHLYYYKGLALYGMEDYAQAKKLLRIYLGREPEDEIAHFYLGNIFFHSEEYQEALASYLHALELRGTFAEVFWNVALVARKLGDAGLEKQIVESGVLNANVHDGGTSDSLAEDPFVSALAIDEALSPWDIPIFINSYNRLGTLQALVAWLVDAGYRNIHVLDNDSTYPPLLDYYASLDGNDKVRVIYLKKNWGHKALWQSRILETLHIDTPYAYTDSDVVPWEGCPKDFLSSLLDILRKYPLLKKAGLGLKTDDITYSDADRTREMEKRFYLHQLEPNVYFGAVDTTMALYRNYRHYHLYVSARTTGNLMARHMPWYYDYDDLPEDERYYMEHANASASLVKRMKENRIL